MSNPFDQDVAAAMARHAAKAAAEQQAKQSEEQRLRLNQDVVKQAIRGIVFPVFQSAAERIIQAGGFAKIEETSEHINKSNRLTLSISLKASPVVANVAPQFYQSITYSGEAYSLAFTLTMAGKSQIIHLPQITEESVTAAVKDFIGTL